jgi:hypothetical protein
MTGAPHALEQPEAAPPGPGSRAVAHRALWLALRAAAGAAAALLLVAAAVAAAAGPAAGLLWLAAEAAFVFEWRARRARLNARPDEHRPPGHDGVATARRYFQLRRYFRFGEAYLKGWFRWGRGRRRRS